ncbi:Metal-dependent hydrolase, beta-lactamase superfamily [Zostera marina]|uniref:Metal-dependent hydrolase, beta-lactamase superfamily n=1 Tax=Zostera marina TaxID=29655 RepID=A0A0K9P728_ZOSMR|nr:Metal-dependent hydrolase, beta-lactamase superfamily [Zostera marina]
MEDEGGTETSSLIFLGTGCSSYVPSGMCLLKPSEPPCDVCFQSMSISPENNPNYRCNTSLLIDYRPGDCDPRYILIDIGKTFRETVLRWFTHYKIPQVDSIILTHEHADACHGLDDLRAMQNTISVNEVVPLPIYLNQFTMDSIARKFPYLVAKKSKDIDWKIIESCSEKSFVASGLQFVPLQVMHGEDYVALAFLFGEKFKVAYLSDVSRIPQNTEHVISKDGGRQLDLLIFDANTPKKIVTRSTHHCLDQSLDAVKRICPKRALFVGMNHDFDHHQHNKILEVWSAKEGIPVQLARDGLRIPVDL